MRKNYYVKKERFSKSFEFTTKSKIKVKIEDIEDMYVISTLFRLPPNSTDNYEHLYKKYRAKLDYWCRNYSSVLKFNEVIKHIYIIEKPAKAQTWTGSSTTASKVVTEYYMYPQLKTNAKIAFSELQKAVEYALAVYDDVEFIDKKERTYKQKKIL